MNKTKIDYADYSWNPVFGCNTGCTYCYAAKYAKRFDRDFRPHWVEKNFQRVMPKKPSIIFVNSMSDIIHWEPSWSEKVLTRIAKYPQHIFLFLTKDPFIYWTNVWLRPRSANVWRGFTATNDKEMIERQAVMEGFPRVWCSAEPLLGSIESVDASLVKWLVVGAMTGAGAIAPRDEWIDAIKNFEGSLFIKNNIRVWWRTSNELTREYPWATAPEVKKICTAG